MSDNTENKNSAPQSTLGKSQTQSRLAQKYGASGRVISSVSKNPPPMPQRPQPAPVQPSQPQPVQPQPKPQSLSQQSAPGQKTTRPRPQNPQPRQAPVQQKPQPQPRPQTAASQSRPQAPAQPRQQSTPQPRPQQPRPQAANQRPTQPQSRPQQPQPRPRPTAPTQSRPQQQTQSSRPAPARTQPAQRRAAVRRRKSFSVDGILAFFSANATLLLCALVVVLIIVGAVVGIKALTREKQPDYILATLITPVPEVEPTDIPFTQPDAQLDTPPADNPLPDDVQTTPDTQLDPTPAPTVSVDEGYFPKSDETSSQSGEGVVPAPVTIGNRTARLRFAGDVVADKEILTTAYNSKNDKHNFTKFFSLIRDQLANADLTAINVDGSMGGKEHYKYGFSGYPQFNTPPQLMQNLYNMGVDMLTLANNHCLDGWFDGLCDTIRNCNKLEMKHIGAFLSEEDFNTPEIYDINGIKVGFLNYTQSLNSMEKRGVDERALQWGLRRTANADYAGDIKALRKGGAEVVVVVMHWGTEYLTQPDKDQLSMAKTIARAGADVIVGGHPHVFQTGGWINTTLDDGSDHRCLVIYSLGNFLSEHRNEAKKRTDAGIIFEFTLQENPTTGKIDVVAPKYLPIAVWRVGQPGAYDYRVVSVDATLENRPDGMSDDQFQRLREVSSEMQEIYGDTGFERISY